MIPFIPLRNQNTSEQITTKLLLPWLQQVHDSYFEIFCHAASPFPPPHMRIGSVWTKHDTQQFGSSSFENGSRLEYDPDYSAQLNKFRICLENLSILSNVTNQSTHPEDAQEPRLNFAPALRATISRWIDTLSKTNKQATFNSLLFEASEDVTRPATSEKSPVRLHRDEERLFRFFSFSFPFIHSFTHDLSFCLFSSLFLTINAVFDHR